MVHSCVAYGCTNLFKKGQDLGFFRFPYQPQRKLQWLLALRRKDYIPSKNARICGAHFQTGRPSRDINHPDYVPNIFNFRNENFDYDEDYQTKTQGYYKKRFKKLAEDLSELPIAKLQNKDIEQTDDDDLLSDSDSYCNENPKCDEFFIPEFETEIENSPLVTVETVKTILAEDAAKNPDILPDKFSIYGKKRIPPKKFTFVDPNGKVLAKFTEKRLRKNTLIEKKRRYHHYFTSHKIKQTVKVIIDKQTAKTTYVDVDSVHGYKDLYKIKKEFYDPPIEYIVPDLFSDAGQFEIKKEIEDYHLDGFDGSLSLDETFDESSDNKIDDDIFGWYSDLRTLENRKLTL